MRGTPKIRGYIADRKNVIVLLYRQSGRVTYMAKLDYSGKHEKLELGSRFYGKFYPNRCDVSADGRFFLYFAMGKHQKNYEKKHHCWTAICRPPNIRALLLFSHNDTWGGGGRFIDNRKFVYVAPGAHPDFDISKKFTFDEYAITFDESHGYNDWVSGKGWETSLRSKFGIGEAWTKKQGPLNITREIGDRRKGDYSVLRYTVVDRKTGERLLEGGGDVQWMDFDNRGRLVVGRGASLEIYKDGHAIRSGTKRVFDLEELVAERARARSK